MIHNETELRNYANAFWNELNEVFPNSKGEFGYLPIVFADPDRDIRAKSSFGFTHTHINTNTKMTSLFPVVFLREDVTDDDIKQTIRHEIIHYYLGLHYSNHEDSCAMFWILCDVFNGGAYEKMDTTQQEIYEISKSYFQDTYSHYKSKGNKKTIAWNLSIMLSLVNKVLLDKDIAYFKAKLNVCSNACRVL